MVMPMTGLKLKLLNLLKILVHQPILLLKASIGKDIVKVVNTVVIIKMDVKQPVL
jgi:hypothetical protein